jgi:hypothetical protein
MFKVPHKFALMELKIKFSVKPHTFVCEDMWSFKIDFDSCSIIVLSIVIAHILFYFFLNLIL